MSSINLVIKISSTSTNDIMLSHCLLKDWLLKIPPFSQVAVISIQLTYANINNRIGTSYFYVYYSNWKENCQLIFQMHRDIRTILMTNDYAVDNRQYLQLVGFSNIRLYSPGYDRSDKLLWGCKTKRGSRTSHINSPPAAGPLISCLLKPIG